MKFFVFIIISLTCIGLLTGQQSSDNLLLSEYLKQISKSNNVHFAYPSQLVNNIKLNKSILYSSKSWNEELQYQLKENGIELEKINSNHILLRKSSVLPSIDYTTITCKVVDQKTKEKLSFAVIYLSDLSVSTLVNENGIFSINIPQSKSNLSLIISYLGYEEINLPIGYFTKNKEIKLTPKEVELSGVIITFVTPFSDLGNKDGITNLTNDIHNLNKSNAAKGNDISSTLLLLPGITANDDDGAGIKIRGGNADETLIILDEIPLYNATHYYGFFNAINADYVSQYNLYKNNLPIEHQGGLSGLLKLNSLNKIPDSSSLTLNANSFLASAYGELKLGKSTSLLVSGRTTYDNINIGMGINNTPTMVENFQKQNTQFNSIIPEYKFNDLHANFLKQWNTKFKTSINFYNTFDNISANTEFTIKKNNFSEDLKRDRLSETKGNIGLSINSSYYLNGNSSLKLSLHHSDYDWKKVNFSTIENYSNEETDYFNNFSVVSESLKDSGIKLYFENSEAKIIEKIGVEYTKYQSTNYQDIGNELTFENDINGSLINVFTEFRFKFHKLEISPALRASSFIIKEKTKFYLSPQVNFSLSISKTVTFKAATGINNQFVREINFEDPFGQQLFITSLADMNTIPVARSWNSMIGYNYSKSKFFFDVEVWYKKTIGAVSLLPDTPPIREREQMYMQGPFSPPPALKYSLITGDRKSFGADIMVGYKSKIYTGWIAYTLSKTQDNYKDLYDGLWFPSANDRRHQLKISNNFSVGKFDLTTNYIFTSGKPYLAYENVGDKKRNDKEIRDQIKILPAYHRVDLGVSYTFSILKKETLLGFSVFNLFNRQNLNFIQYNYKIPPNNQVNPPSVGNANNLTLGTTYGLVNRLISFDFKIRL